MSVVFKGDRCLLIWHFPWVRSPGTTSHRSGVQECPWTSPPQHGSSSRLMECSQNLPPCPCGARRLTYAMALAGAYSQPPGSIHSTAVCIPPRDSRNASQALNPLRASVFYFVCLFCVGFFFHFIKLKYGWFAMLCQSLLYSKWLTYTHICILLYSFPWWFITGYWM